MALRRLPRLQGKKFLLTYPQCTLTKEEVLEAIRAQNGIEEYTIARELHQDGTPHLHACLILSDSPRTTNMRYFDIAQFHPNVKVLKTKADFERATRYCQKDGDFITNIEKRLGKRAQLFKALLDNKDGFTPKFVRDNPEIMGLNFEGLRKWLHFVTPERFVPAHQDLPKRRHIYLYGPVNSGKSYFLNAYISLFDFPQELPRNNDFSGVDPRTDLLYCDEFTADFSIQTINRLCDGRTKHNTKGGSTIVAYPMLLLVSNFTFAELYPNATVVERNAFHARFHQYDSSLSIPPFPVCSIINN